MRSKIMMLKVDDKTVGRQHLQELPSESSTMLCRVLWYKNGHIMHWCWWYVIKTMMMVMKLMMKYHYNLLRMGAPVLPSVSDLDRKKYSGELFRPRFEQFSRQLIALTSGQWPPQLLAQCLYHCQKRLLTSDAHPQFSCDPVPGPCRNMSTMSQFVNFLPQLFSAIHFLWFKVWQTDQLPSCSGHCPP